ncbi:cell death abnormality protein 1-like [Ruditapes philippinarum]|uniref:cell death abnormality protein 1-like n=1 Tax=Ruditapes philippinarum TaxID=129788 RepID=UPI00295B876C|nr:cell death abnormality protein 1-like [Ruditapes philippinarum]
MSLVPALMISFLLLGIFIIYGETTDLGASCTPPAAQAADECTVDNSECKTDTCVCKTGFIKENGACQKVLRRDCKAVDKACPGDVNAECKGDKCVCKAGYAAKNDVCTQNVNGIDCSSVSTACDTIQNATCDATSKKCKCNTGFIMNFNKCDPEKNNSAALMNFGVVSMVLSLLAALIF